MVVADDSTGTSGDKSGWNRAPGKQRPNGLYKIIGLAYCGISACLIRNDVVAKSVSPAHILLTLQRLLIGNNMKSGTDS